MTYLDTWRQQLKDNLATFAPLAKEVLPQHYEFGVIASAILWGIRDSKPEQLQALDVIVTDDEQTSQLKRAIGGWDIKEPIDAVRDLIKQQEKDETLRPALLTLMGYFLDILLETGSLRERPQDKTDDMTINVNAPVDGANVVIGGTQYIVGNLIIQYLRQVLSACPSAPAPPKHFVKRPEEFNQLNDKLNDSDKKPVAVTAVHGMGGIGKTTLIQGFCHQDDAPFDMVLWADITPNPDIASTLLEWASYAIDDYQLPPDKPLSAIVGTVRSYLTDRLVNGKCGKRVLVVFDDVWENGKEAVNLLTQAAPTDAKILITTRYEQVANDLKSHVMALERLSDDEARAMCRNLRDPNKRHLSDDHLQRLVAFVKGHPLTLELAMAALNGSEDATHADRMLANYESGLNADRPFDALKFYVEDAPPELNIVFESSYTALSDDAQGAFRQLGVLASEASWTRQLAGEIWDMDNPDRVTNLHQELRQSAFIQPDAKLTETYNMTFYQQHPLLRSYARALLSDEAFYMKFSNYADYITDVLSGFVLLPRRPHAWLQPYISHIDYIGHQLTDMWNTTSQFEQRFTQQLSRFTELVTPYIKSFPSTAYFEDKISIKGLDWLKAGLDACRQNQDKKGELRVLQDLGLILSLSGNLEEAIRYYEEAIKGYETSEDDSSKSAILHQMGTVYSKRGELQKALEYLLDALSYYKNTDSAREIAILTNIATVLNKSHSFKEAFKFLHIASQVAEQRKDIESQAHIKHEMGSLLYEKKNYVNALIHFQESLGIREQLEDLRGITSTLHQIGSCHLQMNNFDDALKCFQEALSLAKKTADRHGEATILLQIGSVYFVSKQANQALFYLNQALPIMQQVSNYTGEATVLTNLGMVYRELGQDENALECLYTALHILRSINDHPNEALTRYFIADILAIHRVYNKALQHLRQAIAIYPRNPEIQRYHRLIFQIEFMRDTQPVKRHINTRELQYFVLNAICFSYFGKKEQVEWYQYMTQLKLVAENDGDGNEAEFFSALLAIMNDKIPKLPEWNPYSSDLDEVIKAISYNVKDETGRRIDNRILGLLVTNTIVVCTYESSRCNEWRIPLENAHKRAETHKHWNEMAFFTALIAIVDGQDVTLPDDNPYQPHLQQVRDGIENYDPDAENSSNATRIAPQGLDAIVQNTIAVRTFADDKRDDWRETLQGALAQAQSQGHYPEMAFFNTLIAIVDGQDTTLPDDNSYQPHLQQVLDGIENYDPDTAESQVSGVSTLPDEVVNQFCRNTVAVKTVATDQLDNWRKDVQRILTDFISKGDDWANEVSLMNALLNILNDTSATLPDGNPYAEAIQIIQTEIKKYQEENAMSDDKKSDININAPVTGGNVNIGGTQTMGDNINIQYNSLPAAPAESPLGTLKAQLEELETALKSVPKEHAENAELVQEYANDIAEEASKEKPRKKKLEITGEGLKKAAENLATVAPIAVKIAKTLLLIG